MLSIRKETDYAIRCVFYLSQRPGAVILVDAIAGEMQIPRSFLAKIVQKLAKAGLINSQVGAKGGYFLARKPEDISLYDVIVAIEGAVAMNSCTVKKEECGLSPDCVVHPVWISVRRDVENILKLKTFDSLK